MTRKEYTAAQDAWLKEHGLGIGSPVRIVRPFQDVPEYGPAWIPEKFAEIGKEGVIHEIREGGIFIKVPDIIGGLDDTVYFPYTSLEPVLQVQPEAKQKTNRSVEDATAQQIYNRIDNDKSVELLSILLDELKDEQIEYCFVGLCRQRRIELLDKLNTLSNNLDKLPQP